MPLSSKSSVYLMSTHPGSSPYTSPSHYPTSSPKVKLGNISVSRIEHLEQKVEELEANLYEALQALARLAKLHERSSALQEVHIKTLVKLHGSSRPVSEMVQAMKELVADKPEEKKPEKEKEFIEIDKDVLYK